MAYFKRPWVLPLLGVGAVVATGLTLWWYQQKRKSPNKRQSKPEDFIVPVGRVANLWVYPLKSGHRLEVEATDCLARGLKNDRCWVVMNNEGKHVNQKSCPKFATIMPNIEEDENGKCTLILNAPGMDTLTILQPDVSQPTTSISINKVEGDAYDVGDAAADWINRFSGQSNCRIYYMPYSTKNPRKLLLYPAKGDFASPEDETHFADFGPVFIISQASLDDLNSRLDAPVSMTCFRPNIVIDGCSSYAEDNWTEIKIGDQCILKGILQGGRCVMTCVDQESGEKTSDEPIATLRKYRMYEHIYGNSDSRLKAPLFGTNYGVIQPGPVKVGDTVYLKAQSDN